MNLEPIIQSEVSQEEKDKYCILTNIYGIQKNGTEELGQQGEKDIYIPLFITALFIIARTWKQPRCPLTDERIKKLLYIHTVD